MSNKFETPKQTIETLVEACRTGDVEKLKSVFSSNALMTGYFSGEFYTGSPELFYDEVRDNPSPTSTGAEYIGEIISVEEYGDIANVRLQEKGFLGANFTNLFQLVRKDDSWLIYSKLYVDEW
ncbi:MAG: nuclear transport factor 2 family protein [Gammaproteobacteria bacterium]|nr:nuclear transport factor 2 family protein [Gammaproteobacteria bacterium]